MNNDNLIDRDALRAEFELTKLTFVANCLRQMLEALQPEGVTPEDIVEALAVLADEDGWHGRSELERSASRFSSCSRLERMMNLPEAS